jgi:hypothetical protein
VSDCWGESHATSSPTTLQSRACHKFLPSNSLINLFASKRSDTIQGCFLGNNDESSGSTRSAPLIDFIPPMLRQPSRHVFLSHSNCNDLRYSSIHFSFTPRAFNLHYFHCTRYCLNFHHLSGFRIGTNLIPLCPNRRCLITTEVNAT